MYIYKVSASNIYTSYINPLLPGFALLLSPNVDKGWPQGGQVTSLLVQKPGLSLASPRVPLPRRRVGSGRFPGLKRGQNTLILLVIVTYGPSHWPRPRPGNLLVNLLAFACMPFVLLEKWGKVLKYIVVAPFPKYILVVQHWRVIHHWRVMMHTES